MYATYKFDGDDSWNYRFNLFEKGIYNDYNSNWFLDVGQNIYGVMEFNIIMPILSFMVTWLWRYVKRVRD